MARWVKSLVEGTLVGSGGTSLAAALNGRRTLILAYHNIVPNGMTVEGDASLHTDQAVFGRQLDLLRTHATVVPLEAAMEVPTSPVRKLRVAITFDDAYRGALTAGVAELSKRGIPATVFVSPGLLGNEGFWWDRLATNDRTLPPDVREHALRALEGESDRVVDWARQVGKTLHDLPSHARPVCAEELLDPSLYPQIAYGAHTWSHPNLTALSPAEVEEQCRRSREWLSSRTARYSNWLAYPYGMYDASVAAESGRIFDGALRVDGGFVEVRGKRAHRLHETPRLNVPRGLSLNGLRLRIAGLRL